MDPINHYEGQAVMSVCRCGRLHFTYGQITLHFEREEFVAFAGQVGRLAAQLKQMVAGQGLVLLPGQNTTVCH